MANELERSDGDGNANSGESGAEQDNRQQGQSGDDLDQDPRFRKWKSLMDRQLSQAHQTANQAKEEADRLRRESDEARMEQMDEVERANFMVKRMQEENQRLRQDQELAYKAFQRQSEMHRIVAETGIPLEDIENLPNAEQAWTAGIRYLKQQGKDVVSQQAEQNTGQEGESQPSRQRRPVDLGSGTRTDEKQEWYKEYERLKNSGDAIALYAHYEKFRW